MSGALFAVRNVLKAWALLIVACSALAGLGWLLGGYRLLSIFVFCGALLAAALYWTSDRVALGLVGARELPLAEAPGLHSTLERLAARAGVLKPRLYLIPDGLPRALAAGRGPRGSALAVSSGLLSAATPAELEAVIAHELAHVRNRDVVVQTSVVVLAATLLELSRIGGWFQRALLYLLGPIAAAFVHLMLSRNREFLADRDADDGVFAIGVAPAHFRLPRHGAGAVLAAADSAMAYGGGRFFKELGLRSIDHDGSIGSDDHD